MRTVGVVTVARSDYGIYRPVLRKLDADPAFRLQLFVGGMHLSPEFGLTVAEIERDGFPIVERVEMLLSSDTPQGIGKAIGLGVIGFAQAFTRSRPDILLILGDRFEMLAAALAALPFNIPLAHIHGGEATEGLIDEAVRHSLTKMSHQHFVSTETYRERVIQLGEAPWRVVLSGAPALDNVRDVSLLSRTELEERLGLSLERPPLMVTFHPVTLEYEALAGQIEHVLVALDAVNRPVVFSYPNADTHSRRIVRAIEQYVSVHDNTKLVVHLGTQAYFSLMHYAGAMIGNSSSGIIEAASFALPVVNIGDRQRGRVHGRNVIDAECVSSAIVPAIHRALDGKFRSEIVGMKNPYGDGYAATRIVDALKTVPLDRNLLVKAFYDLPSHVRPECE